MSDIHFELKNSDLHHWLGAVASLGELQKSRLQISPQCVILEAINIANTIYFNAEVSEGLNSVETLHIVVGHANHNQVSEGLNSVETI